MLLFYSGDCDSPVFQWLPQYLKYVSIKLRQFAILKNTCTIVETFLSLREVKTIIYAIILHYR